MVCLFFNDSHFIVALVFIALLTAVDHCSARGSDLISLPTQAPRRSGLDNVKQIGSCHVLPWLHLVKDNAPVLFCLLNV